MEKENGRKTLGKVFHCSTSWEDLSCRFCWPSVQHIQTIGCAVCKSHHWLAVVGSAVQNHRGCWLSKFRHESLPAPKQRHAADCCSNTRMVWMAYVTSAYPKVSRRAYACSKSFSTLSGVMLSFASGSGGCGSTGAAGGAGGAAGGGAGAAWNVGVTE